LPWNQIDGHRSGQSTPILWQALPSLFLTTKIMEPLDVVYAGLESLT
jgi:hypothetical protein